MINIDFGKIKKTLTKTALKAKEVSGNAVEATKLKLKISELKSDINDKYAQIGKLVYNSDESYDADDIEKICNEIAELESNIDDITNTLSTLSNVKKCPQCSNDIDKNYSFCPKCGHDFSE